MKFCQPHWDALREAITVRGLEPFVAKGADALSAKIKPDGSMDYEPLFSAHMAIVNNALEMGGTYLLSEDLCPICESEQNGGPPAHWWIENSADEQRMKAVSLGLIPAGS